MRVTGTPLMPALKAIAPTQKAMFDRYDIADNRDKEAALEAARKLVDQQTGETPDLVSIKR